MGHMSTQTYTTQQAAQKLHVETALMGKYSDLAGTAVLHKLLTNLKAK